MTDNKKHPTQEWIEKINKRNSQKVFLVKIVDAIKPNSLNEDMKFVLNSLDDKTPIIKELTPSLEQKFIRDCYTLHDEKDITWEQAISEAFQKLRESVK